jgi:hypothetical protein
MVLTRIAAMLVALVMAAPASAQSAPKPLFAGDAMLHLTIRGPIAQIARSAERSRAPRDAVLTVPGPAPEVLAIQLTPRGITRLKRDVCQFPPLRVTFQRPPAPGSIFSGQKRLKLVTHCRAAASFQQHVLLEYAAYLMYNRLTPASFRVRLATIDYVDQANGPVTTRLGYFIEDIDDVAARNGMRRAVTGERIVLTQLRPADAARVAMFEYMIGNIDWSIRAGPPGEPCCHNAPLIARAGAGSDFVPVPYDFDFSGLVDAPYAVAPDGSSVLKRRYRGFCAQSAYALAMAAVFRSQRAPLLAVLDQVPLAEPARRKAAAYLNGFFTDIADDRKVAAIVPQDLLAITTALERRAAEERAAVPRSSLSSSSLQPTRLLRSRSCSASSPRARHIR